MIFHNRLQKHIYRILKKAYSKLSVGRASRLEKTDAKIDLKLQKETDDDSPSFVGPQHQTKFD